SAPRPKIVVPWKLRTTQRGPARRSLFKSVLGRENKIIEAIDLAQRWRAENHHVIGHIVRPVTASKSQACREGHTSGPCRWLFSAARPIGDVKSLKALHRYNVVKAPAVGVITVWKWPAAFLEGHTSGPCRWLFSAARTQIGFVGDT